MSAAGPGALVPDVAKIAVLRAGGLGDLVFTLPALEALRATYPGAEVILLGAPSYAPLLEGGRWPVDRFVAVPRAPGVSAPGACPADEAALATFAEAMREERFDLALQMHGGGRYSNGLVRRIGARVTAGACTPDAAPLDRCVPYSFYQWEPARWLEVASLVGAPPLSLEPRLEVTADDVAQAEGALPLDGRPLAVLHPGAGDARRRWPAERFAAVGAMLAEAGARVAVIGAATDGEAVREVAGRVAEGAGAEVYDLAGRLSLAGLAGLLSRSAVYAGNDSGPLHLARAVGARTVGLFWCGNLVTAGPATRTRHRVAIGWTVRCPVCDADNGRMRCPHDPSFVADVPVEEVAAPALELLRDAANTPRD